MAFFAPIPIGSLAWGTPLNDSLLDLDARIKALNLGSGTLATDQGQAGWTFDPATNLGTTTIATGVVFMSKIWLREPVNVTTVSASITTAGVGLTAGQNFAGLYDSSGVRLGTTVDQAANWASNGLKTMALTAPVAILGGGAFFVALLANGTTSPTFARGSQLAAGPTTVNIGLNATTARYATSGAALTSLPANITMAARTSSTVAMWGAIG